MIFKLFTVYVYLQTLLCGCGADVRRSGFKRLRTDYKVKVERIGQLDARIRENSGLAYATDSTFWAHPDGGSGSVLYLFDLSGELLQTEKLPIPNRDWEDLAQDTTGNLFIGDFGNNANTRRNLAVYKLRKNMQVTDTIYFNFADQEAFPPPYRKRHHDVEAFFYRSDSLYIFTKSRAFRGLTKLYSLPARSGKYTLMPQEELQVKSPITAAASAPNQEEYALLGYGRLYLFHPENTADVSLKSKRYCLTVGRTGQAEAILYLSPTQLLLTNENGKLFLVTLEKK